MKPHDKVFEFLKERNAKVSEIASALKMKNPEVFSALWILQRDKKIKLVGKEEDFRGRPRNVYGVGEIEMKLTGCLLEQCWPCRNTKLN